MSIDLRNKFNNDEKITMLDSDINKYPNPIKIPFITENNYYEVIVIGMALNGEEFNKGRISMMIDSGTTFSHFPTIYM